MYMDVSVNWLSQFLQDIINLSDSDYERFSKKFYRVQYEDEADARFFKALSEYTDNAREQTLRRA